MIVLTSWVKCLLVFYPGGNFINLEAIFIHILEAILSILKQYAMRRQWTIWFTMSRMRYFTLNTTVLISWGKCLLVSSLEELDGDGESCAADLGGRRSDGSCASCWAKLDVCMGLAGGMSTFPEREVSRGWVPCSATGRGCT